MNRTSTAGLSHLSRLSGLCFLSALLTIAGAPRAQATEAKALERAVAATDAWLGSGLDDRSLLDDTVEAILDAANPGLDHLAREGKRADDPRRKRAIGSLITHVALAFMERENKSGLVYAGQYDRLRVLQPAVGELALRLVLDTPDWFPDNMRASVVPALRDLYPKGPGEDVLTQLRAIALDVDFETDALRKALTSALAQWGQRDLVQKRIDQLEESAGERKTADELHFVRELAGLYYELRDYEAAADLWKEFLGSSTEIDSRPAATDYYNAACCMSRAGRLDDALADLERCAELIRGGHVDSTVELDRRMFEEDPDLRAIRSTARFRAIVGATFDASGGKGKDKVEAKKDE